MRVLLDTHVLLWALAEPHRLDEETRAIIEGDASEVLFSVAKHLGNRYQGGAGPR